MVTAALACIFLILIAVPSIEAKLDKKPYFPDGLTPATDLFPVLPRQKFTMQQDADTSNCYYRQGVDECKKRKGKWSAETVHYNDVSKPITICKCSNVILRYDTIAEGFSQVPQFMRKLVKSVAFVDEESRHAYNQDGHIVIFTKDVVNITDLYVHESAHSHDNGFSSSGKWKQAVDSDTCVPDYYAQSDLVEDYAQNMVVFIYKLFKPSKPPKLPSCMKNQQNAILKRQESGLQQYIKKIKGNKLINQSSKRLQF